MPALRSQTIERVFADAKEKRAMRYTPYRGPTAVTAWVKLKYAAMNLKKLAIHKASKPTAHVAGFAIQGALRNTPTKKDEARNPQRVSKPRLFASDKGEEETNQKQDQYKVLERHGQLVFALNSKITIP